MVIEAPPTRKRAGIYCRVSTDDQAENGYSLADQERKGREQASIKNWDMSDELYVDDGVSGTVRHRPALDRLLRDVEAGKIDVVIITKMDRLARNLKLLLELWDAIESCGASVMVIEESIDTSIPVGRLIRNVMGSIAEFERETIVARTKAGREQKARSGEVSRSPDTTPYGFRYIAKAERSAYEEAVRRGEEPAHTNGWVIVPEEAAVVQRIFESLANGMTMHALAKDLTRGGIPTARGKRVWSVPTIHGILHNPAYWGKAAHGRTTKVKKPGADEGAMRTVRQDKEKVIHGCNPPIVTEELAELAQRTVAANKSLSKRNSKREYLLASSAEHPLLICGMCAAEGKTRRMGGSCRQKKSTHKEYRYYRCSDTKDDASRRHHTIRADGLEAAVWDALHKVLQDPERVLAEIQALSDESSAQAQALTTLIANAEKKLAEIAVKRDALMDFVGVLDKERIVGKDAELAEQEGDLKKQLDALREQRATAEADCLPIIDIKVACDRIERGMEKATFEERQWIVRVLVRRIIATKDRYIIEGVLPILNTNTSTEEGDDDRDTAPLDLIQQCAFVSATG